MNHIAEDFAAAQRHWMAGDWPEAERLCRQVVDGSPGHAPALGLLSELCLRSGRHAEALSWATAALAIDSNQASTHATLGAIYAALGQRASARASLETALRLEPNLAPAHFALGALAEGEGAVASAEEHFAAAARLAPGDANALVRLGQVRYHQRKVDDAQRAFAEAAKVHPLVAWAHCGLGATYQAQGKLDEAMACYRQAIALDPALAQSHYNLGTVLRSLNRLEEAIACYQTALAHAPSLAEANSGLAAAYTLLVQPERAAAAGRRAVELAPNSAVAHAHLAGALQLQGDADGAIAELRRSVALNPADAAIHSNLLYALNFQADYDAPAVFAEHRAWAAAHAEALTAQAPPHANDRTPERRLRVGYVSSHFREHAVSFFSEPLLAAHDPAQVEVFCYADGRQRDATSERFRDRAHVWREIAGLSDAAVAERIREDRIDILVDLAGHIGGNRLLVFARRPAPVQVSYLGYQNTTGMSAIDYRLTDGHADPPGRGEAFYTEELLRLPNQFFCYRPPDASPQVNPLPASASGRITLASLNHINKLTSQAFATWARILSLVPDSRLLVLAYAGGQLETNLRTVMARHGVDGRRLEVVDKRPRYEYLRLHQRIDLALDTFPFNGHTTVCDALWMGVPSIMLEGDRYASRFGGVALRAVGLGELVARDVEEYVRLAVAWSGNLARLAELRQELRSSVQVSPLVDAAAFARDVEAAYRQMWRRWCAQD
jgi:protein O-GlcNAc transferase